MEGSLSHHSCVAILMSFNLKINDWREINSVSGSKEKLKSNAQEIGEIIEGRAYEVSLYCSNACVCFII